MEFLFCNQTHLEILFKWSYCSAKYLEIIVGRIVTGLSKMSTFYFPEVMNVLITCQWEVKVADRTKCAARLTLK